MQELINVANAAMRMSAPIIYAAMGGLIAQQAGVTNIGIEGIALAGAFVGLVVAWQTGSSLLAVVLAAVTGMVLAALFALVAVRLQANPVVVGLGLNLGVAGAASYIMQLTFHARGSLAPAHVAALPRWGLGPLGAVPVLGPILAGHTPVVYGAVLAVLFTWFLLYRTRFGLRLRAAGEDPGAARAAGVAVARVQLLALVISGAITAIGGVQLSIGDLTRFNEGMTNGRGFMALAAYYFGQNRPGLTVVASVVFGFFQALQIRLQSYGYPPQLVQSLPYLIVVVSLAYISYRRLARQRRWQHELPGAAGD